MNTCWLILIENGHTIYRQDRHIWKKEWKKNDIQHNWLFCTKVLVPHLKNRDWNFQFFMQPCKIQVLIIGFIFEMLSKTPRRRAGEEETWGLLKNVKPFFSTYWCCQSFSKYPSRQNSYENEFPPFLTEINDILMLSEFFKIVSTINIFD